MLKWKVDERDDGNVDLQIEDENGVSERIVVHLPPLAPRQEMIDAAIRSIMYERRARNHARLRARLGALEANLTPEELATPPMLAELFISFLAPKHSAQVLLGDLQEMFQKNAERHGKKQARRKYWIEVARSFVPMLWQWLKRIGLFTFLIDYFRSKLGL